MKKREERMKEEKEGKGERGWGCDDHGKQKEKENGFELKQRVRATTMKFVRDRSS